MKSPLMQKIGADTLVLLLALVCAACASTQSSVNPSKPNAVFSKLDELLNKAKEGDPNAQTVLGSIYAKGEGVPKDDTKAVEWYRKAAEQGNAEAQYSLGYMILMGMGVPRDYTKAVEYWQKAAEQGNVKAQGILATMYEHGEIVPKDYTKALEYWRKAAEQGDAKAQFGIASMYSNGKGVPKDSTKAAEWYQKAAEQGNADAQVRLGHMYADGEGVPKDDTKAAALYRKAAEQGNAFGQHSLGYVLWLGIGISRNDTEAAEWLQKAAEQGNADAQTHLGVMYARGEGVPKDDTKAVEWYRKAAEQGNAPAQDILGSMYAHGEVVSKDDAEAVQWFRKSAAQGFAIAQSSLGTMYMEGRGVSKNYVLAYAWLNLAAAQGEKLGQLNRNYLEQHLNSEQRADGQHLASNWKNGDTFDGKPSEVFRDCPSCPEMVVIPSGSFEMGSNEGYKDQQPVHRVNISSNFAMGKTEITRGQFATFVNETRYDAGKKCDTFEVGKWEDRNGRNWRNPGYLQDDNHPVACISWNDAKAYTEWLSRKTGKPYRLPTEAEWEYSCRAGGQQKYCGSDDGDSVAWYGYEKIGKTTHSVATKQANLFGLYDMSGNVWEWVEDSYHDSYTGAPTDGSAWQGDGSRVTRGDSWLRDNNYLMTSTERSQFDPWVRRFDHGFRVARTMP